MPPCAAFLLRASVACRTPSRKKSPRARASAGPVQKRARVLHASEGRETAARLCHPQRRPQSTTAEPALAAPAAITESADAGVVAGPLADAGASPAKPEPGSRGGSRGGARGKEAVQQKEKVPEKSLRSRLAGLLTLGVK